MWVTETTESKSAGEGRTTIATTRVLQSEAQAPGNMLSGRRRHLATACYLVWPTGAKAGRGVRKWALNQVRAQQKSDTGAEEGHQGWSPSYLGLLSYLLFLKKGHKLEVGGAILWKVE